MNCLNAIGRVGRDAETRYTQNGKCILSIAVAVDVGFGDNKSTVWLDCSLWGERGEKLAGHIHKGDRIGVTGELGTREHNGKTYITLRLADVTLLGEKREPQKTEQKPKQKQAMSPSTDDFEDSDVPF